jgi:methylmalonyl-CoA/ethylmalonyl-CoA epimerase
MIRNFSHVSIVVPDIAAAAQQLKTVYGLQAGAVRVNEEQGVRLAYVELGNARIELIEPARPDSPVAGFLKRNPSGGIHHFCLEVDSVERAREEIQSRGARVLGSGEPQWNVDGARIAFVHPAGFLGALVELEERHGATRD